MLDLKRVLAAKPKEHHAVTLARLTTPWGEAIDPARVLSEHPNPQFARMSHRSLNGWWQCSFGYWTEFDFKRHAASAKGKGKDDGPHATLEQMARAVVQAQIPPDSAFDQNILVPFSPEAPLSGVGRELHPGELLWYRRTFEAPSLRHGERLLLHFEAVDHTCSCRVNGATVGNHIGAYDAFAFDITNALVEGTNEIALCVADATEQSGQVRGKQRLDRGDIWYTAQSGIWQSVWLEIVPDARIENAQLTGSASGLITITAQFLVLPGAHQPASMGIDLFDGAGTPVARIVQPVDGTACALSLQVPEPRPWTPDDPHLYRVVLTYGADVVDSYCGLRDVQVMQDGDGNPRLFLNGQPLFLKGVLDQGYWPDGLLTAPSDEALVADIKAARAAGFNLMRKHVKVESSRWYYHCDRLGMLVWQDMPNGGDAGPNPWNWSYKPTLFKHSWDHFTDDTPEHRKTLGGGAQDYQHDWKQTCVATVRQLESHPCIIAWALFNEGWGQFDSKSAYELVAKLDPTRPIDAVSGWYDQGDGDFKSVHNYFRSLKVWPDKGKRAFVISECGGLTFHVNGHSSLEEAYGYASYESEAEWAHAVRALLDELDALEPKGLAGYVYTQLSDIEEETNGLLTYDRRVNKLDV